MKDDNFPLKIFLADDDEDDRMFFGDAVKEIDETIEFLSLKNGNDLIATLATTKLLPQIIFLDLNMPAKNGYESLRDIRRDERFKDIFVAIYSTTASPREIEETLNLGANIFVHKPYSYDGLKEVLRHLFTLNRQRYFPKPPKELYILMAENKFSL